ncbi:MAG: recombinase RecJ [Ruminococcaceae bacterium]|nr:recombinase RecJ [Oscillospiraceae bacterium]
MILQDLHKYSQIVIQVHDNPDADAVGSGYALYRYFSSLGKDVRLVYGGRYAVSKSNMKLMISELNIPIEYITELEPPELLLTVDCQYGEGNVQRFEAQNVAMIDHHSTGRTSGENAEIRSHLVSCATICYAMLNDVGFDVNADTDISTALYYGLYMDSNQLSEINHPLDRDMIDFLQYDKMLITRLKYANFSISELETAGIAITHNNYIEKHRTAIVNSEPCDPNILGVIGDFVIQVDSIDVCIIYNECPGGYKLSVRSCTPAVAANELAAFITEGIGNGGGHFTKAGGFISTQAFEQAHPDIPLDRYFFGRMDEYYHGYDIVNYTDERTDLDLLRRYRKRPAVYGYVRSTDIFSEGTECKVRTLEGDVFITTADDIYLMIGLLGEVYPTEKKVFEARYRPTDKPFVKEFEYQPSIINLAESRSSSLIPYAKQCISDVGTEILARPLERFTKVFTRWNYEAYMSGSKGDMLCCAVDDIKDVYVARRSVFDIMYEEVL